MPTTKSRILGQNVHGWYRYQAFGNDYWTYGTPTTSRFEEIKHSETSVGPPYLENNQFEKWGYSFKPGRINGNLHYGGWKYWNYPFGHNTIPKWYATSLNELNEMETKAIASVNPNVPLVDIPLLLFELRDIPQTIRAIRSVDRLIHGGQTSGLPSTVGSGVLAYKFGIAPVVSDLLALLEISDSVFQRVQALKKASRRGRVSGNLGNSNRTYYDGPWTFLYGKVTVSYRMKNVEHIRRWFTANTTQSFDAALDRPPTRQFREAIGLGNSSQKLSTVWNALPWSWLIDYWWNVGDIVDAVNGGYNSPLSNMCLMKSTNIKSEMEILGVSVPHSGYTMPSIDPGHATMHKKERYVRSVPRPKLAFDPILTKGQIATLTALVSAYSGGSSVRFN